MKKIFSSLLVIGVLTLVLATPASAFPGHSVHYWGRVNGILNGTGQAFQGNLSVTDSEGGYNQSTFAWMSAGSDGMLRANGSATTQMLSGTLSINFSIQQTEWVGPYVMNYIGTWTVVGGTGKYAGATGSGTLGGQATLDRLLLPTQITLGHNFDGTLNLRDTI